MLTYQSTSVLDIEVSERILCTCVKGKQELDVYSYNSNVSILLVSLLSRVSELLRTTPFHF